MSGPTSVSGASWAWVLLGLPVGLLAAFDADGSGVWWAISRTAGLVWRVPYVAPVVTVLAVVAASVALAVGVRALLGRS